MQNRENAGKNKKTVLIIAIALLLVLALTLGGFTFASYISKGSGTDSATVAKWGFVVKADAGNIFSADYTKGEGEFAEAVGTGTGVAVKAAANAVAPGTTGSFTFEISGTAEVKADVSVALTGADIVLKAAAGGETYTYNPIKFSLQKDSAAATENLSFSELQGKLAELNEEVAAGGTYSKAGKYTVTWEWAFDNSEVSVQPNDGEGTALTGDECDTILGMYAFASSSEKVEYNGVEYNGVEYTLTGSVTTLNIKLDVSATQVLE